MFTPGPDTATGCNTSDAEANTVLNENNQPLCAIKKTPIAQLRNPQERKQSTVRCTPSKQTTTQRGIGKLFTPGPEPEADSDTSDADETL